MPFTVEIAVGMSQGSAPRKCLYWARSSNTSAMCVRFDAGNLDYNKYPRNKHYIPNNIYSP